VFRLWIHNLSFVTELCVHIRHVAIGCFLPVTSWVLICETRPTNSTLWIAANKHCTTVQSPKQLLMYLQHINISFYILYKISSILFYQLYNISLRLIIYILQYLQITDVCLSCSLHLSDADLQVFVRISHHQFSWIFSVFCWVPIYIKIPSHSIWSNLTLTQFRRS